MCSLLLISSPVTVTPGRFGHFQLLKVSYVDFALIQVAIMILYF